MIIFLSGVVKRELLEHPHIGFMLQPNMGNRPDLRRTRWAADNGCFAAGEGFRLQFFLDWLESMDEHTKTCLFAVAPDVVGDPDATLRRSLPVLPYLRAFGYRAAFVAQDGQENLPLPWDSFDCLFIGGTDAWKLRPDGKRLAPVVEWLIREAHRRGKWAHIGRVNSFRRYRDAADMGADSCDGTYLRSAPDINLPRLLGWVERLQREPKLALEFI